jgi:hypothetical protein
MSCGVEVWKIEKLVGFGWDMICLPKESGGLGVKKFRVIQ